jgi:hypothetical protein
MTDVTCGKILHGAEKKDAQPRNDSSGPVFQPVPGEALELKRTEPSSCRSALTDR